MSLGKATTEAYKRSRSLQHRRDKTKGKTEFQILFKHLKTQIGAAEI